MMNSLSKERENPKGVVLALAAIITLVNSGYYRATATGSYIPLIALIGLIAFLVLLYYDKLVTIKGSFLPFIFVNAIIFSVLANFGMSNLLSGVRVGATMLCAYIITRVIDAKDFSRIFTTCMKVLIIITLLFEILLTIGIKSFPRLGGYYDLFIVTSTVGANRAFSIFWEPGVFASMIVISVIFDYYIIANRITFVSLAIYVVGFFLASSTAGFLLMFIVLLGLLWRKKESAEKASEQIKSLRKKPKRRFPVGAFAFVLIIVLILLIYDPVVQWLVDINPDIFGKLIETDSDTTATRLDGPLVNLAVFFERPIFGWGFTGSAAEIAFRVDAFGNSNIVAQTSTSTQIMASIGILGIFYSLGFIAPVFSSKKLSHLNSEMKIIIAVCMLFIVNKEPHIFIVASWLVLFYINRADTKKKNIQ